jgi:hypothetical protein
LPTLLEEAAAYGIEHFVVGGFVSNMMEMFWFFVVRQGNSSKDFMKFHQAA